MFDAGHTHGPTPYFVSDCPLCEAAKEARNRAIEHLAEALYLFNGLRGEDPQPSIRLNLGPIGITGDDVHRCHSFDITAKQAEALADAIDSMNNYIGSESAVDQGLRNIASAIEAAIPIDEDRMAQSTARFMGWLQGQSGEAIESGEWSAAAVAQCNPDLYADITDLFTELDPIEITDKVIRDRQADLPDVAQLLDELFGDIPYPYADEDVPLPHDQAQMDSLTAEVESHLKDGGEM